MVPARIVQADAPYQARLATPQLAGPLHHQQIVQTSMVKGLGCDRHESVPSFLPSEAQICCWLGRWSDLRGVDVFDIIINRVQG